MNVYKRATLVLASVLLMTGCVLPTDEAASPVESVPADLFPTTVPSTTTTDPEPDEPAYELALYWHLNTPEGGSILTEVIRRREASATVEEAVALLIEGPSESEQAALAERGTLTPFAPDTLAPSIGVDGTTARVLIADAAGLRANENLLLPVAEELVCTLTGFDDINGVTLSDSEGQLALIDTRSEPIPIPEPATREDYLCDPPEPPPTPETDPDAEGDGDEN